jgi:hypothetical protein
MNNELNRIAKRHKGLGMLQANNTRKQTLDDLMTNSRLAFGLAVLVGFVVFLLVITALQGLAVMYG